MKTLKLMVLSLGLLALPHMASAKKYKKNITSTYKSTHLRSYSSICKSAFAKAKNRCKKLGYFKKIRNRKKYKKWSSGLNKYCKAFTTCTYKRKAKASKKNITSTYKSTHLRSYSSICKSAFARAKNRCKKLGYFKKIRNRKKYKKWSSGLNKYCKAFTTCTYYKK